MTDVFAIIAVFALGHDLTSFAELKQMGAGLTAVEPVILSQRLVSLMTRPLGSRCFVPALHTDRNPRIDPQIFEYTAQEAVFLCPKFAFAFIRAKAIARSQITSFLGSGVTENVLPTGFSGCIKAHQCLSVGT